MNTSNHNENQDDNINIIIESTSQKQYEVSVPKYTLLKDLSSKFYEDIYQEPRDQQGLQKRAVAELVDTKNSNQTLKC